jgi:hypothetical protein
MRLTSTALTVFIIAAASAPGVAQQKRPFDATQWREDVRVIARELPARHPNAFYRLGRTQWDSAVAATEQRIVNETRNQAMVSLMELVALVRDGHTIINPIFDPAGARYYPVEFYQFDDGLFIRSAAPAHSALAGARVLRIGRVSTEEALAAVARVVPTENEWWLRAWGPVFLGLADVLDGLGLVDDPDAVPLVVERAGRRETVIVKPFGRTSPVAHNPAAAIDRSGWTEMRAAGEPPLWLRNPERPYWFDYDSNSRTLYVAYRGVISLPQSPSNTEFWRQVFAVADSLPVNRFVLDIRENIGGNSFFNRQVVRGIVARPNLDRADKLFVVLGERTFSAAMNLARDLEKWTNATFVGQPTGNASVFFGDHVPVALPASGLALNVSTLFWPPYDPRDRREFMAPLIYTPMTSADYRANIDPAMRAIDARATTPSVAARVEAAVLRGDTLEAARILTAAAADVANRFRSPEAEINALGYRLLNAQDNANALAVFRLNTRVFPKSANTWDSLGEALVVSHRVPEGIAAYRRALEIDPDFASSKQALARLQR